MVKNKIACFQVSQTFHILALENVKLKDMLDFLSIAFDIRRLQWLIQFYFTSFVLWTPVSMSFVSDEEIVRRSNKSRSINEEKREKELRQTKIE